MKISNYALFLMIFFGVLSCRAMHVEKYPQKPGKLNVQTSPQRLNAVLFDLDKALTADNKGRRAELRKQMDELYFEPHVLARAQTEPATPPSMAKKAVKPKRALATSRHVYFADDEGKD